MLVPSDDSPVIVEAFEMMATGLYKQTDLDSKQRLQSLIFPAKVTYNKNGTLGTTATASIFKQLQCQVSRESYLVAPDRYTLKQILQEIETIFALREFLPANIAIPALETASVGRADWDRHSATPSLRS